MTLATIKRQLKSFAISLVFRFNIFMVEMPHSLVEMESNGLGIITKMEKQCNLFQMTLIEEQVT